MTIEQALAKLLAGTGLSARQTEPQTYTVILFREPVTDSQVGAASEQESAAVEGEGSEILVTGTHIVGAPVASPVLQVTERQMREAN